MGKNKDKKPQVEAPVIDNAQIEDKKPTDIEQAQQAITPGKGMDLNHKVEFSKLLYEKYNKNLPEDAPYTPEFLAAMNAAGDALNVSILAEEVVAKGSFFGVVVSKRPEVMQAVYSLCASYGIKLPDVKLLAAPTAAQLKSAGMLDAKPEETAVIPISAENISSEAKEKIKKDRKLVLTESVEKPEDVKTPEQLHDSLAKIFIAGKNQLSRAIAAIEFYRGYMKAQKQDDSKLSDVEILDLVKDAIGEPPYKEWGMGNLFRKMVAEDGSIIPAFIAMRNAANNPTSGYTDASDELVAAVARLYVTWGAQNEINKATSNIDMYNKQIEAPKESKDKKVEKNAKEQIAHNEAVIEAMNAIINIAVRPTDEGIATMVDDSLDEKAKNHKIAKHLCDIIKRCYYRDLVITDYPMESWKNNLTQLAGIITNLFRSADEQIKEYSRVNLVTMEKIAKEPTAEETKEESEEKPAEESKN